MRGVTRYREAVENAVDISTHTPHARRDLRYTPQVFEP